MCTKGGLEGISNEIGEEIWKMKPEDEETRMKKQGEIKHTI